MARYAGQTLTEQMIAESTPPARLGDAACPGLILTNGKGRKTWTLRTSVTANGKTTSINAKLGYYPAMSIPAARAAAELARAQILAGDRDVAKEREAKRRQQVANVTGPMTVEKLWERYLRNKLEINRKDKGTVANRIVTKDYDAIKTKRIEDVTPDDVIKIMNTMINRGAATMAAQWRDNLSWAFKDAYESRVISRDLDDPFEPAHRRSKKLKPKVRNEKFREEHWRKWFEWLPDSGLTAQMQQALMLQAASGARIGEILGMNRKQIKFQKDGSATWQGKFKDQARLIYFPKPAAELLRQRMLEQPGQWLFPGRQHAGDKPLSSMAMVTAINSVRHNCPLKLDEEGAERDWSSHTVRRSVRAGLTFERITDADTAERVLGHVITGVRGHYDDPSNHLPAIGEAMENWATLLVKWGAKYPRALKAGEKFA